MEEIKQTCGKIIYERDTHDFRMFEIALQTEKPILGICRGAQLINVALGGTLYQDIPTEIVTNIAHRQTEADNICTHEVNIELDSPLYKILGKSRIAVNSFHHQAIKTLAPSLSVMATSDDGIIEAVCGKGDHYIRAYQWHPELLYKQDELSNKIFADFVANCNKNAKND